MLTSDGYKQLLREQQQQQKRLKIIWEVRTLLDTQLCTAANGNKRELR
jgi:hypothetical protein